MRLHNFTVDVSFQRLDEHAALIDYTTPLRVTVFLCDYSFILDAFALRICAVTLYTLLTRLFVIWCRN